MNVRDGHSEICNLAILRLNIMPHTAVPERVLSGVADLWTLQTPECSHLGRLQTIKMQYEQQTSPKLHAMPHRRKGYCSVCRPAEGLCHSCHLGERRATSAVVLRVAVQATCHQWTTCMDKSPGDVATLMAEVEEQAGPGSIRRAA